jgi:uncharacterized protein YjdB
VKRLSLVIALVLILIMVFGNLVSAQTTVPVTGVSIVIIKSTSPGTPSDPNASPTPADVTVPLGGKIELQALVVPSNASDQNVTWSSSNPTVATVAASSNAIVTPVTVGTTVITVTTTNGGFTDSITVNVVAGVRVTGVSLSRSTMQLGVGSNDFLRATVTPSDATNKNVTWSSSNTAVATVASTSATDARVTAVAPGTAVITVTTEDGARTATCTVTVTSTGTPTPPTGGGLLSALLITAGFTGLATAALIRRRIS